MTFTAIGPSYAVHGAGGMATVLLADVVTCGVRCVLCRLLAKRINPIQAIVHVIDRVLIPDFDIIIGAAA